MRYVLKATAGTDGAALYWKGGDAWTLSVDEAATFASEAMAKATAALLAERGFIRPGASLEFGPTVPVELPPGGRLTSKDEEPFAVQSPWCECSEFTPARVDETSERYVCAVCGRPVAPYIS